MKKKRYDVSKEVELYGPASSFLRNEMDSIGGWLSHHEAAIFCLIDEVQKNQGIEGYLAELGVWHGRGAILMHFLRRAGEALYAIDIFDLREKSHSHFNDPDIFLSHCRRHGADKGLSVIKVDTSATPEILYSSIPVNGCRLFHVDGGHEYASARSDILFGASILLEGGVLVCDDVFAIRFPGVTQALIEMLNENPHLAPFALSNKKVWITSRPYVEVYQRHIIERCGNKNFRRTKLMGTSTLLLM